MKLFLCGLTFVLGFLAMVWFGTPKTDPTSSEDNVIPIADSKMDVTKTDYGKTKDGKLVHLFTCTNSNGTVMKMITYGAIVTSFEIADAKGNRENVTLACKDIAGYEACQSYFGATVGRFCNRIANGKFSIGEEDYVLATNNGENHLHGGNVGFDKVVWDAEPISGEEFIGVRFSYTSKDGEEGYPGTLKVVAEYRLNNQDELIVDLQAETDKETHVNLTNHNYWNLAGPGKEEIKEHMLKIEADKYLPANSALVPTGELKMVDGTVFDFTTFRAMGNRLEEVGDTPKGFDLCYSLRNQDGSLKLAATVKELSSGRKMEIWTTQPGLQFYTGNFLDGSAGSGGFQQYHGFCLETQHYPDSPNQPDFPSTLLKPGEKYRQTTVHKFSVIEE